MAKLWCVMDNEGEPYGSDDGDYFFSKLKEAEDLAISLADECEVQEREFIVYESVAKAARQKAKIMVVK